MTRTNFHIDYSGNKITVIVDDTEIFKNLVKKTQEDIEAFPVVLSKEQITLIKNKFSDVYDQLKAYLDKLEVPYRYRWSTEFVEEYDGAITFKIPLNKTATFYTILTYGTRDAFGQKNRKRLLILTRLLHGEKEVPELSRLARHGQSVVKGEPIGTDNYESDKSLVTLIKMRQRRFSPEDYPQNIPAVLKEFVTIKSGNPLTQKDFINAPRAQNRLVLNTNLKEVEKLVKYALIRTFVDEKKG